jgi:hypothetical protein
MRLVGMVIDGSQTALGFLQNLLDFFGQLSRHIISAAIFLVNGVPATVSRLATLSQTSKQKTFSNRDEGD